MRILHILFISLTLIAPVVAGGENGALFETIVENQWLTSETVDFDNLKYTDYNPVVVFWSRLKGKSH